ncbi:MAG: ATP-binding cassette domain-containing protein [Bacteroidales bacterium]|nr:ATP-binding cassette domain-containing protein [Bacteroidales bacterium]
MEDNILKVEGLSKNYGKLRALSGLDLSINKGQVFGLLGPNGSGKTTTLGIILGATLPDKGSFRWFGQPLAGKSLKRIGAILEHPNFYPYLDAVDNLRIIAQVRCTPEQDIERVLQLTGLSDRRKHRFQTYSFGMKQRLAIASAMLGNPEVLILDEPTNGLDPGGIAEIRELITSIASLGTTIILASHLLDEVQKVCSHVAVLQKGVKLFSGSVDDVLSNTETIVIGSADLSKLETVLKDYPHYLSHTIRGNYAELKTRGMCNPSDVNQFLFSKGISCSHLVMNKKSLESYFLEITGNHPGSEKI